MGEIGLRDKVKVIATTLGLSEFQFNDFIPDVKAFLLKLEKFFLERANDLWPSEAYHPCWITYVSNATQCSELALALEMLLDHYAAYRTMVTNNGQT